MEYKYFYLTGSVLFLLVWGVLYFARKDLRRKMLILSLLFGCWGPISALADTLDWWHPLTITGTRIGIEDFILGFSVGGIAAVLYEELYRKRIRRSHRSFTHFPAFFLLSIVGIYAVLTYALEVHSFFGMMGAGAFGVAWMLLLRRDLVQDSFWSGVLMLAICLPIYLLLFIPFPEYIHRFWVLDGSWHTELIFGIPVAEYLWLFMSGMLIGPLYEFLSHTRVVAAPTRTTG
jgi:hypothetical protein